MNKSITVYRVLAIVASAIGVVISAAGPSVNATATRGRVLLETTHEACSKNHLTVESKSGAHILIPYGQSRNIPVAGGEITWFCGSSKERTGCPITTNLVEIVRSQGRAFTVNCYRETESSDVVLKGIGEACSEKVLTVVGRDKSVHVPYAKSSPDIPVPSSEIIWYCGASRENTTCPDGTNLVRIERGKGRDFTVVCMQRQAK